VNSSANFSLEHVCFENFEHSYAFWLHLCRVCSASLLCTIRYYPLYLSNKDIILSHLANSVVPYHLVYKVKLKSQDYLSGSALTM
jgi:hypothetical protein